MGPDTVIRMHMFRNAFATWGCQAGVVNWLFVWFVRGFPFIPAYLQSLEQRARCLNHSQSQHLAYVRSEER